MIVKSVLAAYYKELSFLYFQKSLGKVRKMHLFKFIKKLIAREKGKTSNLKGGK